VAGREVIPSSNCVNPFRKFAIPCFTTVNETKIDEVVQKQANGNSNVFTSTCGRNVFEFFREREEIGIFGHHQVN